MTLTIRELPRRFRFNGVNLPDPGAQLTPEQVRNVYTAAYPDLATAILQTPVTDADAVTYTFVRNVGTKGAITAAHLLSTLDNGTALAPSPSYPATTPKHFLAANIVQALSFHKGKGHTPLALPQSNLPFLF